MPFVPFYSRFPELGPRETRTVKILNREPLPPDTYAFVDAYCDERKCDCRRTSGSAGC